MWRASVKGSLEFKVTESTLLLSDLLPEATPDFFHLPKSDQYIKNII